MAYNGDIAIASGFIQKNQQNYPLVDASAVNIDDYDTRLNEILDKYAECSTAADTAAKTATIMDNDAEHPAFKLYKGLPVSIKFTNSNTANSPTLDVQGAGAYPIKYNGIQIVSSTNSPDAPPSLLQGVCLFIFDGDTNNPAGGYWHLIGNSGALSNERSGFALAACNISSINPTLTATTSDGCYKKSKGGFVWVDFSASGSGAGVIVDSTLAIDNESASNITYLGARIQPGIIKANDSALFVFDGTNYVLIWCASWGKIIDDDTISIGRTGQAGTNSFAVGNDVQAGNYAHAEGRLTRASGVSSHAEGGPYSYENAGRTYNSVSDAKGLNSHVEGSGTNTLGDAEAGHAEGVFTKVKKIGGHSEGFFTEAGGQYAHVEGYYTVADGNFQHVSGKYNISDDTNYVEIIGNGMSAQARNNARVLDWSGNERLNGTLYVGYEEGVTPGDQVVARQDVLNYDIDGMKPALNTNVFKLCRFGKIGNSITSSTQIKQVDLNSSKGTFVLEEGATISVSFGNQVNTANNPQLKVGSNDAKDIYFNNVQIRSDALSPEAPPSLLKGTCIFIYDGSKWHLIGNDAILSNERYGSAIAEAVLDVSNAAITASTSDGLYKKVKGGYIFVKFTTIAAGGTGVLTHSSLSIDGTTAGNIMYMGAQIGNGIIKAEDEALFVCDGTDYILIWCRSWGEIIDDNTISLGRKANTTAGTNSYAVGYNTEASGIYSHAEGQATKASGESSHAEGNTTTASALYAHAEGYKTKASGNGAHAEGDSTIALGVFSHAEGSSAIALSTDAHAEGGNTVAQGLYAHAQGSHTSAYGAATTALGKYNIPGNINSFPAWGTNTQYYAGMFVKHNNNGYVCAVAHKSGDLFDSTKWTQCGSTLSLAETVGNGSTSSRSNARALDWDGNEYLKGDVYVNCNSDSTEGTAVGATLSLKADKANPVLTGSISLGRKANTEVGLNSIALGYNTEASEANTIAVGQSAAAIVGGASAFGIGTIAGGVGSHVVGWYNASGSLPIWTKNTHYNVGDRVKRIEQVEEFTIIGEYECIVENNDSRFEESHWTSISSPKFSKFIEIVGNGEDENHRSNARAVDYEGNEYLAGDIYVGCDADSSGGNKLGHVFQGVLNPSDNTKFHNNMLAGSTWQFINTPFDGVTETMSISVGFYSNSKNYNRIDIQYSVGSKTIMYYGNDGEEFYADEAYVDYNGWNNACQTVTFTSEPAPFDPNDNPSGYKPDKETCLSWLYSHATKTAHITPTMLGEEYVHADNAIYVDIVTGKTYYWDGVQYTECSATPDIIDDTAEEGDTDKTWSADKIYTELDSKAPLANPVFMGSATVGSRSGSRGVYSFATGNGIKATGMYSHGEGYETTASGTQSHAEGSGSKSVGLSSHAEGGYTEAHGKYSHAEGYGTKAYGKSQHVSGEYNIANGYAQYPQYEEYHSYHVGDIIYTDFYYEDDIKVYKCITDWVSGHNNFDATKFQLLFTESQSYAEIVGNGTETTPSNARTLDWDGNETLAGNITINGGSLTIGNTTITEQQLIALLNMLN